MISEQELIKKLVLWLKENRATTLADKLGYKSTATVMAWVQKKRVPSHMQERVLSVITSHRKG